ncbi:MAG: alpha/beta fold hydrolase [Pseudomonadota bacterium]
MLSAPRLEAVSIAGPAGAIEASIEPGSDNPPAIAVVCHPHPQHGGTMRNKVVHTLARTFVTLGATAVRFNFRGVGASEGNYDEGRGELDDALAVLDWAAERWPGTPLWVAGFSFGGWVALRAAARRTVTQLVTVAPAVDRFTVDDTDAVSCPWVLIQGGADELVSADAVLAWAKQLDHGPEILLMPGVDHFFHGRLTDLKSRLLESLGES